MQELSPPRLILVLQSDPSHQNLIQEVLATSNLRPQVVTMDNGQAALDFLKREGSDVGMSRPDLILLDLDLPGELSSRRLLQQIKGDPQLRRIPVIVLTLSDRAEDIFHAYAIQSNCYIVRPGDRAQLTQVIQRIENFWLNIVTLPLE